MSSSSTPQIQAIIFDFDGTLVDTVEIFLQIFLEVGDRYGTNVTAHDFYAKNGMTVKDSLKLYIKEGKFKWWIVPYLLLTSRRMDRRIHREANIYPQVHEVLTELKANYKIGLATSNKRKNVNHLFDKFGLTNYFEKVITRDDVKHEKPNPEPYLKMARMLGVNPENCLVVEDTPVGVLAAKRAKMMTCAVEHSTPQQYFEGEKKPDVFIQKIERLSLDFINQHYQLS